MDRKALLEDKVKKTMNVMSGEMKVARDYGIGFALYHSEVHLLDAISAHEGANAGELANLLGVTKGAVTQVAGKLESKALIDRYRLEGNKKEVYYSLTDLGRKACIGHKKHHEIINAEFHRYVERLDESDIQKILEFLDAVVVGMQNE